MSEKRGSFPPGGLASIKGSSQPYVEPVWTAGEALTNRANSTSADIQQSTYLAASSGLIQFNAIVAAIQGSLLTFGGDAASKTAAAGALLLHVLAAFLLCWAARPIEDAPSTVRGMSFAALDDYRHASHTFRNYRRGWRMTLLALSVSSSAAALFALNSFGVAPSDIAALWR